MNTMTLPASAEPAARPGWSVGRWASRIGRFLAYSFVAMVLGVLGFGLVLTLLAAGVSTVIVWIGLPLLVAGVYAARGFAAAGRGVQGFLLGTDLPTPAAKPAPDGAGWMRRLLTPLTDPQSWLNALWILVSFVLSLITFPATIAWVLGAIATIGGPIATVVLHRVLPEADRDGLGHVRCVPGLCQCSPAFWVSLHRF